jgi:hypothetical protein
MEDLKFKLTLAVTWSVLYSLLQQDVHFHDQDPCHDMVSATVQRRKEVFIQV